MKLPEIKTRNKFRDAKICALFLDNELSTEQIGAKFGISGRQVNRILYKNADVLKLDKEWEKINRMLWLKKQIKAKGDSKKDAAELQLQLKEEIEGSKSSGDVRVTVVMNNVALEGKPLEYRLGELNRS